MKKFWLKFHLTIYFFIAQQDQLNKRCFYHSTTIKMVLFYDTELVLVSIHYQLQYIFLTKDEKDFKYLVHSQSNSI